MKVAGDEVSRRLLEVGVPPKGLGRVPALEHPDQWRLLSCVLTHPRVPVVLAVGIAPSGLAAGAPGGSMTVGRLADRSPPMNDKPRRVR